MEKLTTGNASPNPSNRSMQGNQEVSASLGSRIINFFTLSNSPSVPAAPKDDVKTLEYLNNQKLIEQYAFEAKQGSSVILAAAIVKKSNYRPEQYHYFNIESHPGKLTLLPPISFQNKEGIFSDSLIHQIEKVQNNLSAYISGSAEKMFEENYENLVIDFCGKPYGKNSHKSYQEFISVLRKYLYQKCGFDSDQANKSMEIILKAPFTGWNHTLMWPIGF